MTALRIAEPLYKRLTADLLKDAPMESVAVGYAVYQQERGTWLLQEAAVVVGDAYGHRSSIAASIGGAFAVESANNSRGRKASIVVIHTHPMARGNPSFSSIDDAGEAELAPYFERRAPIGNHLALVVGPQGCRARRLATDEEVPVIIVGREVRGLASVSSAIADDWADRQVRAFGDEGQRIIRSLHVGIVGLGGTGSVACQELAHLGVDRFTLIDPDKLEATNLNRVAGSKPSDVGTAKVDVTRRMVDDIRLGADVTTIVGDVVDDATADRLLECDFLLICTDSHASRAVVNQIAYQHLIPTIDMGTSITVDDEGAVTHISGRVQMLSPGLPCLVCCRTLNGEEIRREMMSPEERARDRYIVGGAVPQPSVMSINGTLSSLAITMFLGAVTAIPAHARWQRYDGISGRVRETTASIDADCIVCSVEGALAQGTGWPLPARKPRLGIADA